MARVLVVGDVMLDEFVYGDVRRISPEAATPVLSVTHSTQMLGGAGNVARGVQALGTPCCLVGIVGSDRAGHDLTHEMRELHLPSVVVDATRPTTRKTRFVSTQHSTHMLRVDNENIKPVSAAVERCVIDRAVDALEDSDVLVLSDYCKGVVTRPVVEALLKAARFQRKTVIVDSKRPDLSVFKGANIIKLNAEELAKAYNSTQDWINIGFSHTDKDIESIGIAGLSVANQFNIENMIVTLGERGMILLSIRNGDALPLVQIPGRVVRVRDVSGAGDTVVATLAARLAHKQDLRAALHVANDAAAIAVGKPGTAVVTAAELNNGNVAPLGDWTLLEQRLGEWKGKRIGFTNGCFDLLHPGHMHLLMQARSRCDKLIVGLNSDSSVRALKGEGRPVQDEHTRAEMLAALDNVDLVVVFDGDTPHDLAKLIRPDVMFKGDDYNAADVAGHEFATQVQIIPRIAGHSTTATIGRIK